MWSKKIREIWDPLANSGTDKKRASDVPITPQTQSPAYRLAYADEDFMCREELRPIRLQLELLKPEMILQEREICSTIVMFGGARIPEPGKEPWAAKNEIQAENLRKSAKYYDEARKFAKICSEYSASTEYRDYVIVTGGGPGVMEAGNRGANDVDAPSIGLNIVLPHEQAPNEYVTPELSLNFHYFAIRKMHFLLRAKAITVFPGGFGTFDELFEALTLIQTKRMDPVPIILFGSDFWHTMFNFKALAEYGTISPDDIDLFNIVETADEAWAIIQNHYQ